MTISSDDQEIQDLLIKVQTLEAENARLREAAADVVKEDSKTYPLKSRGIKEGHPDYWSAERWSEVMKKLAAALDGDE